MQSVIVNVCVLHSNQVVAALGCVRSFGYWLHPVSSWAALEREMQRAPNSIAVVDPFFGGNAAGGEPTPEFSALLSGYASTPMVAAYAVHSRHPMQTRRLASLGVAEVLDLGSPLEPAALSVMLDAVRGYRMRAVLNTAVPRSTSARARAILAAVGDTVAAGGLAPELAARLGVTERTLLRWCLKLDLGQPRRLMAWLRLLLAADMLSEGNRSVASVAHACGYSSDPSLRNAFRVIGRTTPTAVRRARSIAAVAQRFGEELTLRWSACSEHRGAEQYLN